MSQLDLFGLSTDPDKQAGELFAKFAEWSELVEKAAPIFDIEGERLEEVARDLAQHQYFYGVLKQDAKALVKWLEIQKSQKESRYLKNYNNTPRALGVKEQGIYLQGEKDVVEMNQLITEANLRAQQFDEIVEAIKNLGWMVGNMTKLRVASIEEAVI